MSLYTWLWLGWLGMLVAVEATALFNKREGDTLSEHVWSWFKVTRTPKRFTVVRFILLGFLVWLTGHLAFGWWSAT